MQTVKPGLTKEVGCTTTSNRFDALTLEECSSDEVEEAPLSSGKKSMEPISDKVLSVEKLQGATQCLNQTVAIDNTLEYADMNLRPPSNHAKESAYLKTLDSCLDICNVVLNNSESEKVKAINNTRDELLVDKGEFFDPANPETWPESVKQADKEIALVMARMANPPPAKPKKKLEINVKLVKGNSGGAVLRSSTRNKR